MKTSQPTRLLLLGCFALLGTVALHAQDNLNSLQLDKTLVTTNTVLPSAAVVDTTVAPVPAAESAVTTNGSFSVNEPLKRAPWLQHLTLGPGDVFNISLFNTPDTARDNIFVGPDGRINYLQARDVMATGLTVDELRAKLESDLGKYYRSPIVIVQPQAYRSKKYFVLGAVGNKGVYTMERPLTIIEAVGRAGGLASGLFDRSTVEMADLSRSFLVRNGQRLTVDFEKLFQSGDLSQNVPVEPNDYLYFASASASEIYVLGEVFAPGSEGFLPKATMVSAITAHGGFTPTAYKSRVLVVRGSLSKPETFVVDTAAILAGRAPDFRLQPKDIVYVAARPWAKAEELLDMAAMSFVQAAFVTYTGAHVGPFITSPIIK